MGKLQTISDTDELRFLRLKIESVVEAEEYEYAALIRIRIKELQERTRGEFYTAVQSR